MNDLLDHEFPQAIVNHQASAVLALTWQDGSVSALPHAALRSACKCAACEQHFRSTGRRIEASPTTHIADIRPVGDKGLNFVFSDGHGRGIYPWAHLREIARVQAS